ncbi:MAG: Threonylcarbamoyladenosine tRNA methylthiotransferase MtaB [Alphaproteobacteria bacterium MarineAlpha11_Bin1]|nr:MAG: Threonylcarbamoyladenosine tRNA methylthiotransferase MtaB [Alphaproteobacteria bacterium MarineAlpha11_Bin1]|tara:strand:+ start:1676 stop:2938 length:1263 start_codon:yes stop_codon:yes gene_type:complete
MSATQILNFGCRLNAFEAEVMRGHAEVAGLNDAIIVNSCAVTAEAERQVRQSIRRAKRNNPNAKIIVTGCAAQVDPLKYASMDEVDHVVGNEEKLLAETWPNILNSPSISVMDIMTVRESAGHLVSGFDGRMRAFVEIQQGCDHRCTFCIIPFGRGNNRSVPVGVIVEQLRTLVRQGYREVVLTGVDITDYGKDLPGTPRLGEMVRRLLKLVPELPRLRLSSVDPAEIDDTLFNLIADEQRLMPHFHLSVQSGDDLILKRMKRRHRRSDVKSFVQRVRTLRPDAAFGADIIAGFPTESEDAFSNSLSLVHDCRLTWLHVFPYSERPGTPAARMPQLPGNIRKERAAKLRAAGAAQVRDFLDAQIGSVADVLVEGEGRGYSPQFADVRIEGTPDQVPAEGRIVPARIVARDNQTLTAQLAT